MEYGFNIDKLTAQFLSKIQNTSPSQHFEICISKSLGMMKSSVMDLADKIRERINQYYAATDSVTHSSVFPLIDQCQTSLDQLEKLFGLRESMREKIERHSTEIRSQVSKIEDVRTKSSSIKDLKKLIGRTC